MSNYLAIATVTAAIKEILQQALQVVPGKEVRVGRPEDLSSDELARYGANLYLYQVMPNASLRNRDLATRRGDGTLVQQPQVALDLNYWIAFYGQKKDTRLEVERMLGSAATLLHAHPVLTRERLRNIIESPSYDYLSTSNLDRQIESVKLTPLTMPLEDLSKLWTAFSQAAHRLSLFYQASVVVLDADLSPEQALPVASGQFALAPSSPPAIANITPTVLEYAPTAVVTIRGDNLGGDNSSGDNLGVWFGNLEGTVRTHSQTSMTASLPDGIVAGATTVQVVRVLPSGSTTVARSNTVPLILQPHVTDNVRFQTVQLARLPDRSDLDNPSISSIATIAVEIAPDIDPEREIVLSLNPLQPSSRSAKGYSFTSLLRFRLPADVQTDLEGGAVSPALQQAFARQGFPLSLDAAVTEIEANRRWIVRETESDRAYSIRQCQQQLMVYYGLLGDDAAIANASAFQIEGVAAGTYLVRVRLVGPQLIESRLRANSQGEYANPQVTVT